jgi:hypothetical protein
MDRLAPRDRARACATLYAMKMPGSTLHGIALAAVLILAGAPHAAAAVPTELDKGALVIYSNDRPVGRETFSLVSVEDTLVFASECTFSMDVGKGPQPMKKTMRYVVLRPSWKFIMYQSVQTVDGTEYIIGVYPGSDTTVSIYHETGKVGGTGDVLYRPPGPLYVVDPWMFALFQAVPTSFGPASVDVRPVNVLALARRDTVVDARIREFGSQTIRWGAKPVSARSLRFEQAGLGYDLWVDPQGRVLRIEHVPSGLRVEREAPKVKARPKTPPHGGG